jgi:anti-anti-sigma factor
VSDLAEVTATSTHEITRLAVIGEVDLSNAADIGERLASAVPGDAVRVVLDLSRTPYMDSQGLAMLFRFAEKCGWQRQELRIVAPRDSAIRMTLELTRIGDVVPIDDSAPA